GCTRRTGAGSCTTSSSRASASCPITAPSSTRSCRPSPTRRSCRSSRRRRPSPRPAQAPARRRAGADARPARRTHAMAGRRIRTIIASILVVSALLITGTRGPAQDRLPVDTLKLPSGFEIRVFAAHVPGARSMTLSPGGTLFLGTRGEGVVYAIASATRAATAERPRVIARRLNTPNGVAFRDRALYVAEINRVLRYDDIEARLDKPPAPVVVTDRFPRDRHHGWKFIAFGPDGLLYVPVGAPCNICEPPTPLHQTITRLRVDDGAPDVVARGVRNSVGFDWHPTTKTLWFTDNGRDWLGDDRPPDELNHASRDGLHFGYP